jgi:hypothetical protein
LGNYLSDFTGAAQDAKADDATDGDSEYKPAG